MLGEGKSLKIKGRTVNLLIWFIFVSTWDLVKMIVKDY